MPVIPIIVDPIGPAPVQGPSPFNVIRYVGQPNVPRDIQRQRRNNLDTMRRFGAPVILKHMWNISDVEVGLAEPSPNYSSVYKQSRHNDPTSHGVGYVSVEKSDNEWVTPDGTSIVVSNTSPGAGYARAPKYRGYGPGYLVYVIMPDVSQDLFKLSETGALIRVQQAQVQMGWYPQASDNDLLITLEVDNGENIVVTHERYLLKQTSPASMRGLDRKGRREYGEDFGNRHITDQSFEMTLIPPNDELYNVEVDR